MSVDVPRETAERLDHFESLVRAGNIRQNLVSATTLETFRQRHINDSLQLLPHILPGVMIDIGSGAGLPGLVLACCRTGPVHLIEPRARRADFLANAVREIGLPHVEVHCLSVERLLMPDVATITARAVAALPDLFAMAVHLIAPATRWVLPKGRTVSTELEAARRTWQGDFRLIPSRTDPDAAIVLAEAVRRRHAR